MKRFRSCIESFVEDQERSAQRHVKAAENTIDDWNAFVDRELR